MAKTKLGKVSLTPKGEWDSTTAYEQLDLVSYGGSSWVAKKSNTNVAPSESDFWMMIAESGVTDYNALENKPSIPTKVSELSNDSGYITGDGTAKFATAIAYPRTTSSNLDFSSYSMSPWASGNHLAFLPPEQIIIEESTDGGTTWADAGVSDTIKRNLFSGNVLSHIKLPTVTGGYANSGKCKIRVTLSAFKFNVPEGTAETEKFNYWRPAYFVSKERYVSFRGFYIWVSQGGSNRWLTVKVQVGFYPEHSFSNVIPETKIAGWAGGNFVTVPSGKTEMLFGSGTGKSTDSYGNVFLRFEFTAVCSESVTSNFIPSIYLITGVGGNTWEKSNNMTYHNHIYSWDAYQNATFPANLSASSMSVGNYPVALQKDFSLIEAITLTEDTMSIERSQKPDGTAYNFKEVVIVLKCLNTGAYNYMVFLNGSPEYICVLTTDATYTYYSIAWIKMRGALIEYLGNATAGYLGLANTRSSLPSIGTYANNKNTIQKIKLYNGNRPLPSGAIVYIYGIDA